MTIGVHHDPLPLTANADTGRGLGLYIHIPFCHLRCHFCAFYLQLHTDPAVDRFLHALELELAWYGRQAPLHARPFQTIYFGGGTPTTLRADQLRRILHLVRTTFTLAADVEITVEGHPDTLSLDQLRQLANAGVTRLSLGAESFDHGELIRVGRPTEPTSLARAMGLVREAGFTNVNLDLMYGLPGQTLESWQSTLASALTFEPSHLSCYALTVEDGTALAQSVAVGARPAPDPDMQTAMEQLAETHLTAAGYQRYEISNYAKPGWACRHNQLYWEQGEYIGLGPSAESYYDGVRFGNVADLTAYADALQQNHRPLAHEERLSVAQQQREAVVFGLRQSVGVERRLVEALSADRVWQDRVTDLLAQGLLSVHEERIRFTEQGRQLADSIAATLIAEGNGVAVRPRS